jgi:branched-chain amino acid transport system permease protein
MMQFTTFQKISLVIFLLLLIVPFQNVVYDLFMMKVFCFAIFAASLNLLLGYVGLLSFGHAAFFGSAAYVTAHAMKEWGVTPEIGLLLGVATSAAIGYVFGALAIRRQGIYFAMITLALAQVIYFLATQLPFTNGEDGIQGVPRGEFLGLIDLSNSTAMYLFSLGVFALAFVLIIRIVNSPFGQVLKSIRENEPRAISLGYDVDRYKLIAFTLSAALAGLGGALKSLVLQLASLGDVFWHMSGEAVLMTILGGIGTLWGPIAGAAIIVNLQNYLANLGGWSTIATGAIFVICVLAFRKGVVGELADRLKIKL